MEQPILNEHNKQEYPPMHTGEINISSIIKCVLILVGVLLFVSCGRIEQFLQDRNDRKELEKIVGVNLNGMIKYERSNQYFVDLIGDGYRVTEYSVIDTSALKNIRNIFIPYNQDNYPNQPEIKDYLIGTSGYYKRCEVVDDVERFVFYDTIHQKLIYYFSIM